MPANKRLGVAGVVALLLAACGGGSGGSGANAGPPTSSPSTATTSAAPVYFGWQTGSLISGGQYVTMGSVSCVSSTVCYALGAGPTGINAMYGTTDSGQNWGEILSPAAPNEFYAGLSCTDTSHCWITSTALTFNHANQTSSVFLLDPSMRTARKQTLPTDAATGSLVGVRCISNSVCWAFGSTIIATTDGGSTWADQSDPLPATASIKDMSFSSPLNGVAVGANTALRTNNGGASWSSTTIPNASIRSINCFSATQCLAVGVLGSDTGTAWRSDDGGATWTEQSLPSGFIPTSIECGAGSGGGPAVCRATGDTSAGAALATTPDGGATWNTLSLPAEISSPGSYLNAISCSAFTLCVAVGVDPNHNGAIVSAVNGAVQVGKQQCADVALLTIRGSGEQLAQAPEVDEAAANLASALPLATTYRTIKVPYQAVPINISDLPALFDSINQGVIIVNNQVRFMVTNCRHEQIVIIGFSQGAAVADLALTNLQNEKVPGTNHVLGDWVTHVSLLADPLRMTGRQIDVAAVPSMWPAQEPRPTIDNVADWETENGLFPHFLGASVGENIPSAFTKLEHGWTRTVSWCVPGDWVCEAPGIGLSHMVSMDLTLHGLYTNGQVQTEVATAARGHVIDALSRFSQGG